MRPFMPIRGLWLRIFAFGLAILVLSALTLATVFTWLVRPQVDEVGSRFDAWFGEAACARLGEPPAQLQRALAQLPMAVTAYAPDGTRLGFAGGEPVPLPPRGTVTHGGDAPHTYACPDGRGTIAIGKPGPGLPLHAPMLAAALVLGVLGLCTLPVARSLARPLEELVAVVNLWGDGQLAARTGMQRKDEFGVLARAFDLAAERLQALMRSERELLANISHELRTPLARLRLVVEIAREAPERTQGLLDEIGHDLQELERLVDDVLTGVRLDMGAATATGASLPLHLEPLDLAEVLTQARERFLATHPDRELGLELGAALPRVLGDRRLLRRLVDNLVDNARKYSAAPAPVRVRARAEGGGVVVEVADQGFGMDAAELQQLGSPFFRSARSRSQTQGTGLGFMLSTLIARAHHGTLEARSTPDVGTTMTFRLRAID